MSSYRRLGIWPGAISLAIGIMHFFMPTLGYDPADLRAIPEAQREHFAYLGTYAIGSFLVALGLITMVLAPRLRASDAAFLFSLMTIVWGLRAAMELVWPVDLRLFVLDYPTTVLLPIQVLIFVLYAAVSYLAFREFGRRS